MQARWSWALAGALVVSACDDEGGGPVGPDPPAETDVYVANFSAETVRDVYLRPEGAAAWGDDRLAGLVRPGNWYGYVARVESGRWDVRMVGEVRTIDLTGREVVGDAIAFSFPAEVPGP